ncbi:MAG: anti-sigma factor [Gemmatimonadaceae bacterium]
MDCRTFNSRHLAFLDNTTSDAELVEMQRHIAECARCARHDAAVRRSLLLFRNIPLVEPSPDFGARLTTRLRQLSLAEAQARLSHGPPPGVGAFVAAVSGVVVVGFLAASALNWTEPRRDLVLPAIVASMPEVPPPPILDRTFVSSAAAGMPVWPTAVLAEQSTAHFVSAQFQLASYRP